MKGFLTVFIIAAVSRLSGQNLSWSQPPTALLYINPAFTGTSGKYSVAAGYRDQWNSISSSYKTALVAADYRLGGTRQPLGLNTGIIFFNDITSSGLLRTNGFGFTVSSLLRANRQISIGAGGAFHMMRTTIYSERFTWGSQYQGGNYNPSLASGEEENAFFLDYTNLQAGVSMLFQENPNEIDYTENAIILAGYSLDHLNRANVGVSGTPELLQFKHTFYAEAYFPAGNDTGIKPRLLAAMQGPHHTVLAGGLWREALGQVSRVTGIHKGAGISFGVMYRVMDAVIPVVEFEKENLLIGLSYDVNVSALTPVSKLRGGAELSIRLRPAFKPVVETPQAAPAPTTRSPVY